jgi:L,D-peptidoglycan transpeptidase YkuD (ErfK/YbiS/YcfS/YnhG family)
MAQFAFGMRVSAPKGCGLSWRRITPRSWWSSEHDATYNTWVETSRRIDGEHLADYRVSYEYALHTGYNALPNRQVYGRGAAIFIHVEHRGYSAGCVTLARADMTALLRLLRSGERLSCAVGTTRGSATAILGY